MLNQKPGIFRGYKSLLPWIALAALMGFGMIRAIF